MAGTVPMWGRRDGANQERRMSCRGIGWTATAAAAAIVLAGCGGSSGLSKEKLAARANTICATSNAAADRVPAPADFDTNPVAAAAYLDKVLRLEQSGVDQLKALKPDSSAKAGFETYVADLTHQLGLLRSADRKAHAKDSSGLQDIAAMKTYQQRTSHPAALRLGFTKCAGSGETASASGEDTTGTIHVVYDPPTSSDNAQAEQILRLGGTDGVAKGFTHSFALPSDITIHAVNEFVGPNWNPRTKTITVSYPFVVYIAKTLKENFPALRSNDYEFGQELAAVDGFVLTHEFGHALIALFNLPVLGKEEDAADSLAAVFFIKFVSGGAQYAFDAAKFFHAMSARQRKLAPADYWDQHSLDEQRADSIVCWVAGSGQQTYQAVAKLGILGQDRLKTCPAEYQQKLQSWTELLRQHVRG
jgi:Putative metallopeptidase